MRNLTKTIQLGLTAATVAAAPVFGQAAETPPKMPDSATVRAHKKLFNDRDLVMLGASVQTNHFLKNASHGVEVIASPGAYYIGGSLYIVGRLTRQPRIADLGWHGTEAVLLGELTSYAIKGMVGRARPFVAIDD